MPGPAQPNSILHQAAVELKMPKLNSQAHYDILTLLYDLTLASGRPHEVPRVSVSSLTWAICAICSSESDLRRGAKVQQHNPDSGAKPNRAKQRDGFVIVLVIGNF